MEFKFSADIFLLFLCRTFKIYWWPWSFKIY